MNLHQGIGRITPVREMVDEGWADMVKPQSAGCSRAQGAGRSPAAWCAIGRMVCRARYHAGTRTAGAPFVGMGRVQG